MIIQEFSCCACRRLVLACGRINVQSQVAILKPTLSNPLLTQVDAPEMEFSAHEGYDATSEKYKIQLRLGNSTNQDVALST